MDFLNYIKNRFPLQLYIPIIILFYIVFYTYAGFFDSKIIFSLRTIIGFFILFFLFLKIRILDDIKDKELKTNNLDILKKYFLILTVVQLTLSASLGITPLFLYILITIFSIGIFYDFNLKNFFLEHKIISNLIHQLLIIIIGFFVYTIYYNHLYPVEVLYVLLILNMYIVFAMFEIVRKIKIDELIKNYKTYKNILGRTKFSLLLFIFVLSIGVLTVFNILETTENYFFITIEAIITFIVLFSLIGYDFEKIKDKHLKIICFLFMLTTLLTIIISNINSKGLLFQSGLMVI